MVAKMKERPILFSAEMVRAILDGRKTQTRRVVKGMALDWLQPGMFSPKFVADPENYLSPYGYAGDRLWVRETLCTEIDATMAEMECGKFAYKADDESNLWTSVNGYRIIPSIYMPRWASRVTLEVVNVRVERVQEISREDAKAEGVSNLWRWDQARNEKHPEHFVRGVLNPFVANYSVLWDEINGKRGFGWDVNPWVWVIEFRRMS